MRLRKGDALSSLIGGVPSRDMVALLERWRSTQPMPEFTVGGFERKMPEAWEEVNFHPSGDCTKCMRLMWFERSPKWGPRLWREVVTPRLQRVFDVGTAIHAMLQAQVERMCAFAGYPRFIGNEVRLTEGERWGIGGYADTIVRYDGDDVDTIIDWKTCAHSMFTRVRGGKQEHRMQLNCYMMMYGAPSKAQLVYYDKDTQDMLCVDVPAMDMGNVLMRWSMVRAAARGHDATPLGYGDKEDSSTCKRCPASAWCRKAGDDGNGGR